MPNLSNQPSSSSTCAPPRTRSSCTSGNQPYRTPRLCERTASWHHRGPAISVACPESPQRHPAVQGRSSTSWKSGGEGAASSCPSSPVVQLMEQKVLAASADRYTFFGAENKNPKHGDVDARGLKVQEPNVKAEKLINVTYLQELKNLEKIMAWLEKAAERMQGKTRAYCSQGRERSAFHVFAALYVNDGLDKSTAANLVESAVLKAQNKNDQTVRMLSGATWFTIIPFKHQKSVTPSVIVPITTVPSSNNNNNTTTTPSTTTIPVPQVPTITTNNTTTTTTTSTTPYRSNWLPIRESEVRDVVERNNQGWGKPKVKYPP